MTQEFYIEINGEKIPVTRDVYYAYMRPIWRENKRNQTWEDRECSFETYQERAGELPSNQKLVEEIAEDHMLLETLLAALEILTQDERGLIKDLFFAEKSETEIAGDKGVSKQAINAQKSRALRKIKNFLKKSPK